MWEDFLDGEENLHWGQVIHAAGYNWSSSCAEDKAGQFPGWRQGVLRHRPGFPQECLLQDTKEINCLHQDSASSLCFIRCLPGFATESFTSDGTGSRLDVEHLFFFLLLCFAVCFFIVSLNIYWEQLIKKMCWGITVMDVFIYCNTNVSKFTLFLLILLFLAVSVLFFIFRGKQVWAPHAPMFNVSLCWSPFVCRILTAFRT